MADAQAEPKPLLPALKPFYDVAVRYPGWSCALELAGISWSMDMERSRSDQLPAS